MRRGIGQADKRIEQADCTSGQKTAVVGIWIFRGRIIEEDDVLRRPQRRDIQPFSMLRNDANRSWPRRFPNTYCRDSDLHCNLPRRSPSSTPSALIMSAKSSRVTIRELDARIIRRSADVVCPYTCNIQD